MQPTFDVLRSFHQQRKFAARTNVAHRFDRVEVLRKSGQARQGRQDRNTLPVNACSQPHRWQSRRAGCRSDLPQRNEGSRSAANPLLRAGCAGSSQTASHQWHSAKGAPTGGVRVVPRYQRNQRHMRQAKTGVRGGFTGNGAGSGRKLAISWRRRRFGRAGVSGRLKVAGGLGVFLVFKHSALIFAAGHPGN